MKLTRGLLVGSMLGMAAAMMMNNQNNANNTDNTSYSSDMNQNRSQNKNNSINSLNNYDNPSTNGSSLIITDIIK